MTACGRRWSALVAVAVLGNGCVTGHLLDLGRRRERLLAVREASTTGEQLMVHYTALVSDDIDTPLAERERWATLLLNGGGQTLRIDTTRPPDDGVPEPVLVVPGDGDGPLPPSPAALVVRDIRIPASAFTRSTHAAWVCPLLPLTLGFDAVTTPALLVFAPAVISVGE